MSVNLSPLGGAGWQFFDSNGVPLAGGLLYTYSAGTTTPVVTYTTNSGNVANSNPIVLDASGRVANEIWITGGTSIKFVLQTASATQIGSYDNISGINDITSFSSTSSINVGAGQIGFKQSNGTTFFTGAVARTVGSKLNEQVSVLDFGADPTGITDSTTAFTNAFAASLNVYMPPGIYSVSNLVPPQYLNLTGAGRYAGTPGTFLQASVSNQPIFNLSAGTYNTVMSNFTAGVASGVSNAYFWSDSSSTGNYSAYCIFNNVETRAEFTISYNVNFIFLSMLNCRDGYEGTPSSSLKHQAINSLSKSPYTNQTNLNQIRSCQFFNSSATIGAVSISVGENWLFDACDFESNTTVAVTASGIYGLAFRNCWFENNTIPTNYGVINASIADGQGTAPIQFDSCYFFLSGNPSDSTSYLVNIGGACDYTITNCTIADAPNTCVISNVLVTNAYFGNHTVASNPNFFTGLQAQTSNQLITNSQLGSGVINTPQVQNQNMLPIGPTGLGASNFTNINFTTIANTASNLGTTGQAVQFTLAGSTNQVAYYQIPSKLVTFLRNQTLTLIIQGFGSGGGGDAMSAVIWDSVSPSATNFTSQSANSIVTTSSTLQVAYVQVTVSGSSSSLYVGVRCGGSAGGQTINLENMKFVLGYILPTSTGF